jgi:hypothetical protein
MHLLSKYLDARFDGRSGGASDKGSMSANLCTESRMRELIEQGFEVAVASDATAAAIVEAIRKINE